MEKRGIRRGCASPRPLSATHVADRRPQPRATKSQEPSRGRMASVELDRMGDPPPRPNTHTKQNKNEGGWDVWDVCVAAHHHSGVTVVSPQHHSGVTMRLQWYSSCAAPDMCHRPARPRQTPGSRER